MWGIATISCVLKVEAAARVTAPRRRLTKRFASGVAGAIGVDRALHCARVAAIVERGVARACAAVAGCAPIIIPATTMVMSLVPLGERNAAEHVS
eukprot:gene6716-biopygen5347